MSLCRDWNVAESPAELLAIANAITATHRPRRRRLSKVVLLGPEPTSRGARMERPHRRAAARGRTPPLAGRYRSRCFSTPLDNSAFPATRWVSPLAAPLPRRTKPLLARWMIFCATTRNCGPRTVFWYRTSGGASGVESVAAWAFCRCRRVGERAWWRLRRVRLWCGIGALRRWVESDREALSPTSPAAAGR
jgi:hypothetical protein